MPLLDHFHPPLEDEIPWSTLHAGWATRIADNLNERWLDKEYVAAEVVTSGLHPEVDIAARQPTKPEMTFAATFPEVFEVQILTGKNRRQLVGVIELVNPSNKDRPTERRAFAAKAAAYLTNGVCVVLMDMVTSKRYNLHNEIVELLAAPLESQMPDSQVIYAVSYRPTFREDKPQIDLWREALKIGQPLPTMPLRLTGDLFVPVEFESTYLETCRRRRLL